MKRGMRTASCAALLTAGALACEPARPVSPSTTPPPSTPTSIFDSGVTRAEPATLKFMVQPTAAASGAIIAPAVVVAVLDTLGELDRSARIALTLTIKPYVDGVLHGTTTQVTSGGIATFSDLSVSEPMANWSLMVSAPNRHWVKSMQFAVTRDSAFAATPRQ